MVFQVIGFFGAVLVLHVCYNSDKYLPAALGGESANAETEEGRRLSEFPKDLVLDGNDDKYSNSTNKYMLILHAIGTIYMFAGLAVVCDDYFVAALEVMCEKWNISEDVAGATFMAAGGSAPELFTSLIGVFAAESDVGFGTIVGSAVFNVLFVIGLCALFARQALELTWWPLARDCSCYTVGLIVLVLCVSDSKVEWYEAAILLLCYLGYVTIMKFNAQLKAKVAACISCGKVQPEAARLEQKKSDAALQAAAEAMDRSMHKPAASTSPKKEMGSKKISHYLHHTALKAENEAVRFRDFRSAVLRAMMHGHLANLNKKLVTASGGTELERRKSWRYRAAWATAAKAATHQDKTAGEKKQKEGGLAQDSEIGIVHDQVVPVDGSGFVIDDDEITTPDAKEAPSGGEAAASEGSAKGTKMLVIKESDKEEEVPAFMGQEDMDEDDDSLWDVPETLGYKILWALTLPLNFLMWLTIPNCTKEKWESWFIVTFFMSLVWIAGFSYCMVWWASVMGFALGIPDAVMGLTILAGGTSIPDALSSVIVARNGFGDMAVSSSIGSNIFDINVGLPLPWLLKTGIVDSGSHISIGSCGMDILTISLLVMVLFVILSIKFSGWKLNMTLGGIMFLLYLLFVAESLLIAYEIIDIGC